MACFLNGEATNDGDQKEKEDRQNRQAAADAALELGDTASPRSPHGLSPSLGYVVPPLWSDWCAEGILAPTVPTVNARLRGPTFSARFPAVSGGFGLDQGL